MICNCSGTYISERTFPTHYLPNERIIFSHNSASTRKYAKSSGWTWKPMLGLHRALLAKTDIPQYLCHQHLYVRFLSHSTPKAGSYKKSFIPTTIMWWDKIKKQGLIHSVNFEVGKDFNIQQIIDIQQPTPFLHVMSLPVIQMLLFSLLRFATSLLSSASHQWVSFFYMEPRFYYWVHSHSYTKVTKQTTTSQSHIRLDPCIGYKWNYCTFAGKTFDVKMPGLDSKHFAFAWLTTLMAMDDRLFSWVMKILGMGYCKRHTEIMRCTRFFPIWVTSYKLSQKVLLNKQLWYWIGSNGKGVK